MRTLILAVSALSTIGSSIALGADAMDATTPSAAVGGSAPSESSSATKWKIKGKARVDAAQSSKSTKVGEGDATIAKSSSVAVKRAQLELIGTKGNDELRLKYYLEKNELKYAFIEHKFSKECSLVAGFFDARDLAWEWDYSSTEQYIYANVSKYGIVAQPGVEVKGGIEDQWFYLQVLQGATPAGVTFEKSSGGLTTSLQYRGNFMDKMLRPIATYAMVRTANSKGTLTNADKSTTAVNYDKVYQTHMGLGLKVAVAGSTTDIEYATVKNHKLKDDDTSKDKNAASFLIQSRLPEISGAVPYLKAVVDTDKKGADKNEGDLARTAYALGAEYAWDSSIRLHAIFSIDQAKTTQAKGDQTVNEQKINFGITGSI
ncbi:MAG: hypothetical protein NT027_04420 [Proteobacteria bacterium]|nr:hypothetical protein [Pseudomonadota bacterium]